MGCIWVLLRTVLKIIAKMVQAIVHLKNLKKWGPYHACVSRRNIPKSQLRWESPKIPVESLGSIPGSQIEQNINSAIIYQANHIMSITVYPLIFVDS